MQLAGLSDDDMIAVNNMRCLCGPDTKKSTGGGFTLKFDVHKVKHYRFFLNLYSYVIWISKCIHFSIANRRNMHIEKSEQGKNQHGRCPDFILF